MTIIIAIRSTLGSTDVLKSKTDLDSMPGSYLSASYFNHPLEMLLDLLFLQSDCVPICGITNK